MLPGRSDISAPSRAFSLIELLVVISIIALLVSILLPALGEARRAARRSVCMANMQQFGVAHQAYASDFKGFIAVIPEHAKDEGNIHSLMTRSEFARDLVRSRDPNAVSGNLAMYQAISGTNVPVVIEQHSHLALIDYLGEKPVMPGAACPEDRPLHAWRKLTPVTIIYSTQFMPILRTNWKWLPYGSSYQLMPTAYLRDVPKPYQGESAENLFHQGETHNTYTYNKAELLGGRKLDQVSFPAQKVAVADGFQRHFGKLDLYFTHIAAKQPVLFWDASVSMRETAASNKGWDRTDPRSEETQLFAYAPDLNYEPPVPPGDETSKSHMVTSRYKWTRGGLRGVDFGGSETHTEGY